jgi:hypothetical protein
MGQTNVAGGAGTGDGAAGSGTAAGAGGAGGGANGNNNNNQNKKKKEEMECGESGTYGDLKKKTGKGLFDRDHVPSKGALKEFARKELNLGQELCKDQKRAIDAVGEAIAIPKWLHQKFSRTYGGLNSESTIGTDAADLQAAAKRDVENVKKGLGDQNMSPECKKKYEAWADKVGETTNEQYRDKLSKAMQSGKTT